MHGKFQSDLVAVDDNALELVTALSALQTVESKEAFLKQYHPYTYINCLKSTKRALDLMLLYDGNPRTYSWYILVKLLPELRR